MIFSKKPDESNNEVMQAMLENEAKQGSDMVSPVGFNEDPIAKWELETESEIDGIKNTFLGIEKVEGGYIKTGEAVINNKGINTLLLPIKAINNKMTSLSNFTDDAIRSDCTEFKRAIRKQLIYNRKEWGVQKINYGAISQTLDTLMYSALSKAREALLLKIRRQQFITKQLIANKPSGGMGGVSQGFPGV